MVWRYPAQANGDSFSPPEPFCKFTRTRNACHCRPHMNVSNTKSDRKDPGDNVDVRHKKVSQEGVPWVRRCRAGGVALLGGKTPTEVCRQSSAVLEVYSCVSSFKFARVKLRQPGIFSAAAFSLLPLQFESLSLSLLKWSEGECSSTQFQPLKLDVSFSYPWGWRMPPLRAISGLNALVKFPSGCFERFHGAPFLAVILPDVQLRRSARVRII